LCFAYLHGHESVEFKVECVSCVSLRLIWDMRRCISWRFFWFESVNKQEKIVDEAAGSRMERTLLDTGPWTGWLSLLF
jgi:hypothetical protein